MLIDQSYFIGEINIAQLGQKAVQEKLFVFIQKREPEYLKAVMGYALFKAYSAGTEAEPFDQRWTDIIEGAEYTDCRGNLQKWEGFSNEELLSPIANYVYYWYQRDNASATTATGEKQEDTQGTVTVSPAMKQARAWNEMVELNCKFHDFLRNKKNDAGALVYPEFKESCIERNIMSRINIFNL